MTPTLDSPAETQGTLLEASAARSASDIATLLSEAPTDETRCAISALDDSKAEDIKVINITEKSSLGDAMIIASGRSNRHVGAIADAVTRDLKAAGHGNASVEGLPHCDWVLIDTGDIIVHIFRPEVREFYNLEKMWETAAIEQNA